jgi:hypothetical protein
MDTTMDTTMAVVVIWEVETWEAVISRDVTRSTSSPLLLKRPLLTDFLACAIDDKGRCDLFF